MSISDKIKGIFKSTLANSKEKLGYTKENLDKAIARVAEITGRDDRAGEIYSKILSENPDDVNASVNLGIIKYKEKDFSASADLFSNALENSDELDPYSEFKDSDIIFYSALMIRLSEPSKALQAVEGKNFKIEHILDFFIINAISYNMLGDIEKEIEFLFKIHEYLQKKSWKSSVFESGDLLNSSFSVSGMQDHETQNIESENTRTQSFRSDNTESGDLSKKLCLKIICLLSSSRDQKFSIDSLIKLYSLDKALCPLILHSI